MGNWVDAFIDIPKTVVDESFFHKLDFCFGEVGFNEPGDAMQWSSDIEEWNDISWDERANIKGKTAFITLEYCMSAPFEHSMHIKISYCDERYSCRLEISPHLTNHFLKWTNTQNKYDENRVWIAERFKQVCALLHRELSAKRTVAQSDYNDEPTFDFESTDEITRRFLEVPHEIKACKKDRVLYSIKMAAWENWEELSLSRMRIRTLPDEIGECQNLKCLDLSGNKLELLPDSLQNLENLLSLDLRGNRFKTIPSCISKLTDLHGLYLSENQIKEVPGFLGALPKLAILLLERNRIEKLPEWLADCPQLQQLFISRNPLQSLPKKLSDRQVIKDFRNKER